MFLIIPFVMGQMAFYNKTFCVLSLSLSLWLSLSFIDCSVSGISHCSFWPKERTFLCKHAGSDQEAFWLWPVMAITASVQPESDRIVYAGSDFPHPFQLRISEKGMGHTVQNRLGSDLDGLARVWLNVSGLEASRCAGIIWPGFWQGCNRPATSFPTFRLGSILPQTSRIILCKTGPGPT